MKILVTGGAGFIGSHIVERLLLEGHDVRVLDDYSTGYSKNLAAIAPHIEIVQGDICNYQKVCNVLRSVEVVFHQAALCSVARSVREPQKTNTVNIGGTLTVLQAARDENVRRVIYASSSSVYGNSPTMPKRETQVCAPASPYAVTKLAGELYSRIFHQLFGIETFSLRYFNVFGPRQAPNSPYAPVIPKFINALLNEEPPIIDGDGQQSRDFSYIDNVVEANILAMKADSGFGEVFNVACGQRNTVAQLVGYLTTFTGVVKQPIHQQPRPGDVRHSLADITKAEAVLSYRPIIHFLGGLERTVEWYRSHSDDVFGSSLQSSSDNSSL